MTTPSAKADSPLALIFMVTQLPTYSISVNAFEAGVLMGMIEGAEERIKPPLSGIRSQLIAMKKDVEKADGVVKKLLRNGMLEIKDEDGNRIIRPPYSWEIESN